MLRITVAENKSVQMIKLEGKIAGPWVEELRRAWHSLTLSPRRKRLKLDIRGVGFVDANGRQLLREIYQQTDACFLADSPLTQLFTNDAMRQSLKNGTGD